MQKIKKQRAFTLIELLVVIAIGMIVAAILITNLSSRLSERQIEAETREFVGFIREVQGYALTGKQFVNTNDPCFYQVVWGGGSYNFTYYYKTGADCSTNASVVIATYALDGQVAFSGSNSFYFSPPHARPSFASGTSMGATLVKGGTMKTVCTSYDGLVREVAGSTCP